MVHLSSVSELFSINFDWYVSVINTNFNQKKLILFCFVFPAKNVLMRGRRVLLADFDTATRLLNEVTEKGLKRCGTKGFVSPEVFRQILTMPLLEGDSKSLTNRFHVAVRLFSNGSQMTSKCGKNEAHEAQPSVSLMLLPHFGVFCVLLLNRRTATWNLFVLYNKKIKIYRKNAFYFKFRHFDRHEDSTDMI